MRRGIMRYNEIKRVNNLLCTILLQVNSQHGDRFNISICVSLQCGFSPVFRILKTKIACDLFFRKARTYPRNCFILELIKFTSVKKKKKRKKWKDEQAAHVKMMTSCHVSVFFWRGFASHHFALGRKVAIFAAKCFGFFFGTAK